MDHVEIDWEIARDIIAQYFAVTAGELANAKENELSGSVRIQELETRLKKLRQEKMQLTSDNTNLINKAFTEYAQALRKDNK